jgi:deoxyribodipyrimidine photo-lyase
VTVIHLFTRDLRCADNPALSAACRSDATIPLFVLDDRCLKAHASANRIAFLVESLVDLRLTLRRLGADLVVRRGCPEKEVAALARATKATKVTVAKDVTRYSTARSRRIVAALRASPETAGVELETYPGITVVAPDGVVTTQGRPYRVFTPYWRAWTQTPRRHILGLPDRVRLPDGVDAGPIPSFHQICGSGQTPAKTLCGGESAGRRRMFDWIWANGRRYRRGDESLTDEGSSSRLGAYLHFGCVSPAELESLAASAGLDTFVRELCWRDFNHQLAAAFPDISRAELNPRGDKWSDDPIMLDAWKLGRTGYPLIDAAMRQLAAEGWMHNRLRMVTASFLTKVLGIDWRLGAAHFMRHLVDGDLVNNSANWQWVAGTGTDTRPNRTYNPIRQAERFDPDGDYVRTWVPELRGVPGRTVHEPWKLEGRLEAPSGYPPRIVDYAAAAGQFLAHRTNRS